MQFAIEIQKPQSAIVFVAFVFLWNYEVDESETVFTAFVFLVFG